MRIVGGVWRGRAIEAPEGRGTRPTTDRMRESLASMVLSARGLDIGDCSVLDAFAGSGGVGLELLSRGARHCTFCDKDRRAAAIVRRNCQSLGAPKESWDVLCLDAFRACSLSDMRGAPFDVVFLDPPYALAATSVAELVESLDRAGLLASECLVVYERATSADALCDVASGQSRCAGFVPLRSKKHGGTTVELLRKDT
ncbi:MAG: 16S rRNA (guanine(966)-N(2))-methyltransferase RsmD [Atopobiaceae bacterium]|nr:16S rRNA (guanine(966)-N(2))-methyltransferase RsmD [Atopobiaceae bacterium]